MTSVSSFISRFAVVIARIPTGTISHQTGHHVLGSAIRMESQFKASPGHLARFNEHKLSSVGNEHGRELISCQDSPATTYKSVLMQVFCIGLSRTGTRSLTRALRVLGYQARHFGYTAEALCLSKSGQLSLDLNHFQEPGAYLDLPVAAFFEELDAVYPDALFIHTIRNKESWLEACERRFRKPRPEPAHAALREKVYGRPVFHRESFEAAYERHQIRVRTHFENRPDKLLTLDICSGEGWEKLCAFLQKAVPEDAFPQVPSRSKGAWRRTRWRLKKWLGLTPGS